MFKQSWRPTTRRCNAFEAGARLAEFFGSWDLDYSLQQLTLSVTTKSRQKPHFLILLLNTTLVSLPNTQIPNLKIYVSTLILFGQLLSKFAIWF